MTYTQVESAVVMFLSPLEAINTPLFNRCIVRNFQSQLLLRKKLKKKLRKLMWSSAGIHTFHNFATKTCFPLVITFFPPCQQSSKESLVTHIVGLWGPSLRLSTQVQRTPSFFCSGLGRFLCLPKWTEFLSFPPAANGIFSQVCFCHSSAAASRPDPILFSVNNWAARGKKAWFFTSPHVVSIRAGPKSDTEAF